MKQRSQKQYAGVWIDNNKAFIISKNSENEDADYSIKEKIQAKENHGGGSEHSMNNAKQSDSVKYFKSLSGQLLDYDEILLFGPGKSQEQFQNHLNEDPQFKSRKIIVETAEQLSDGQMIARVRDFYKSHQS